MDKSRLFERSRSEMRTTAELDIVLVLKAIRSTRCLGVAGNDLCYLERRRGAGNNQRPETRLAGLETCRHRREGCADSRRTIPANRLKAVRSSFLSCARMRAALPRPRWFAVVRAGPSWATVPT
jgi:hypothetical protein